MDDLRIGKPPMHDTDPKPDTRRARRLHLKLLALVLAIVFGAEGVVIVGTLIGLPGSSMAVLAFVDAIVLALVTAPLIWWLVVRPLDEELRMEEARIEKSERALREQASAREFDARLYRALEIADGEEEVIDALARATAAVIGEASAELLLADSSRAHLRRVVSIGSGGPPGCPVELPSKCVAVREGQPLRFGSSEALDACPHLRGRPGGECSALCVPINVLGRAAGVLHVTGAPGRPPEDRATAQLRGLASQTGNRLGMLRALAKSELQAATDSLTGLLNRRSLEDQAKALWAAERSLALLVADLDHFKRLNDTYGHDAGDRALRLVARVLRGSLRPEDLVARYGGEEFVCVLADSDRQGGAKAAERIRAALARAIASVSAPEFTISFGVADSSDGETVEEALRIADNALYAAKRAGRNRVVVSDAVTAPAEDDAAGAPADGA